MVGLCKTHVFTYLVAKRDIARTVLLPTCLQKIIHVAPFLSKRTGFSRKICTEQRPISTFVEQHHKVGNLPAFRFLPTNSGISSSDMVQWQHMHLLRLDQEPKPAARFEATTRTWKRHFAAQG
jgi:hypothetical protein